MSDDQLEQVMESAELYPVKSDEQLFREGESVSQLMVLRRGTLKRYFRSADGKEKILDVVGPLQLVDECLGGGERYRCDCKAMEDGELFACDCDLYNSILKQQPLDAAPLFSHLSSRLNYFTEETVALSSLGAQQRLCRYLFSLIECEQKQYCKKIEDKCSDCGCELPASKSTVASLLSVQRETLSRMLKEMREKGVIKVQGNVIRFADLNRFCQGVI